MSLTANMTLTAASRVTPRRVGVWAGCGLGLGSGRGLVAWRGVGSGAERVLTSFQRTLTGPGCWVLGSVRLPGGGGCSLVRRRHCIPLLHKALVAGRGVPPPGWAKAMALEAARSRTRGSGWSPRGRASAGAARSRPAFPHEAQQPGQSGERPCGLLAVLPTGEWWRPPAARRPRHGRRAGPFLRPPL